MMKLVIEGLATEKPVEEVKQAATQSIEKVTVIQVELGGLHIKIIVPTE